MLEFPERQEPPGEERSQLAALSCAPKTLNVLWDEWEVGIGGHKATKDFTPREHGAVSQKRIQ